MRAKIFSTIVFACVLAPLTAHAQDADKLFKEARKLVEAGNYARACPMFAESERIEPAPGTLLNLADCEKMLGHLLDAQEHYRLAAAGFQRTDPRHAFCAKKAEELDARIAHVTIRLAPGSPDGTVVKRSGVPIADLGKPIAVDPGLAMIIVTAPGRSDHPYPLTIKDGDTVDLTVQPGDPEQAHTEVRTEVVTREVPIVSATAAASSPLRPVGIVVASVGVASLAAGIVTGLMALDRANTVKTDCNTTTNVCLDQSGYDAAADGRVLSPLSTATFIAGGVLLAVGAVFFVLGGKHAHVQTAAWLHGWTLSGTF